MNGKKKTQKEDSTPVPSSSSKEGLVLLGAAPVSNRSGQSGTGSLPVCQMQEAKTSGGQKDMGSRPYRANRKATYRFLRLGTIPRANVQRPPTAFMPTLPQKKNSK